MMDEPIGTRPPTLWLKVVLVSCWITQIAFAVSLFSAFVIIGTPRDSWPDKRSLIIWIALSIVPLTVISLNLAEIVLFIRHELRPRTYLILQYVKSGLWIALSVGLCVWVTLIMILLVTMKDWEPTYWFMLVMFLIATVCFVVPLIYAHNVHYYASHGLGNQTQSEDIDEDTPLLREGNQVPVEPMPPRRSTILTGGRTASSRVHVHRRREEP